MKGPEIRSQKRAAYDFIMQQSKELGLDNVLAYPGFLRSETILNSGQSFDFDLMANATKDGQAIGGTENRLLQNDAFYIERIGLFLYTATVTSNGAGNPLTNAVRAVARLHQFPNLQVFAANTPSIIGLYNGRLTIKQNERIYCRDHDLYSMQYVDTAQQGQTVFTASTVDASAFDNERSFVEAAEPMFRLNGQSNVEATIDLPAPLSFTNVTDATVYAVLYLKGWRAQNGGIARTAR